MEAENKYTPANVKYVDGNNTVGSETMETNNSPASHSRAAEVTNTQIETNVGEGSEEGWKIPQDMHIS